MAKLPAFEDWRRPWTEGEVDEEKLARLVYNLKVDIEKRDEKIEGKDAELSGLTSELDTVKASKASPDPEIQDELKTLRAENRTLKASSEEPRPQDQGRIDRLEIALELGLSKGDAARLVGGTREDLLADAHEFAKDHGIEVKGAEQEDPPAERQIPSRAPISNLRISTQGKGLTVGSNPAAARKALEDIAL